MKQKKLFNFLAFAMFSLLVVSCNKNPVNSASSSSDSVSSSINSSSSSVSTSSSSGNKSGLAEAFAADYSNAVFQVYARYNSDYGMLEEGFYEYNYEGYTIIESDNGIEKSYLYYHDYEGESYLYFEDRYGNGDAWLKETYALNTLNKVGLENTYFSWEYSKKFLHAEDFLLSDGIYYVSSSEAIQELNATMFAFAWQNEIVDIAITIQDGLISRIIGFGEEAANQDNQEFVQINFLYVGSTTFGKPLPEAPNENSLMDWYTYSGTTPFVEKLITTITLSLNGDMHLELDDEVEISYTYLPLDATDKNIELVATEQGIVEFTYVREDLENNQWRWKRVVRALRPGSTTIYAKNEKSGVQSNEITITVKEAPQPQQEGLLYDLSFMSIVDNSLYMINNVDNNKLPTAVTTKGQILTVTDSEETRWSKGTRVLALNPGENGMGAASVTFNFGRQQVSGISFYYGLFWPNDVQSLSFLKEATISISNDGINYQVVKDMLDEVKASASATNLKLIEATFAPTTYVRVAFGNNFTGKHTRFSFSSMSFYADENCVELDPPVVEIPVESVAISPTSVEQLTVGDEITFQSSVLPIDATNKDLTWTSSNENVATVVNGVVSAVGAGECLISAKSANNVVSNEVVISVKEKEQLKIENQYIATWKGRDLYDDVDALLEITEQSLTIKINDSTYTLDLLEKNEYREYVFADSEDNSLTIKMNNYSKLDVTGNVGDYLFAQSDADGFAKYVPLTGISASAGKTTLEIGETTTISVSYTPYTTTESKTATYTSSDKNVATVSSTGQIKAVGAGNCTITVTVGKFHAEITITVNPKEVVDTNMPAEIIGTWTYDDEYYAEITLIITEDGSANFSYMLGEYDFTFTCVKEGKIYFEGSIVDDLIITYENGTLSVYCADSMFADAVGPFTK